MTDIIKDIPLDKLIAFPGKPDAQLIAALQSSVDCLRMAEKLLKDGGMPATALHLALQAEENMRLLHTTAGFR